MPIDLGSFEWPPAGSGGGGGGSGTVTSVAISSDDGSILVSGSPITTSGVIDISVQGTPNTLSWFDSGGVLGSLDKWGVSPYGGLSYNNTDPVTGDFRVVVATSAGTVSNNGAGVLVFQSAAVTQSWTGYGTYVNADIGDGMSGAAIGFDAQFSAGTIAADVTGLSLSNSSVITGAHSIRGVNLQNTGNGGSFSALAASNSGDMADSIQGLSFVSSGDGRTGTALDANYSGAFVDDLNGLRLNMQPSVAGSLSGASLQLSGVIDNSANGLQIGMGGVTADSVTGISVNMNGAVTSDPQGVVGFSSDSRIGINASTQLMPALGFQIGNRVECLFTIPPGSPVTGTDSLGNNFAGDLAAQDDLAIGPAGIGWNSVGFIASVGVAVGKTVGKATVFLPAMSIPDPGFTTGGTITELAMIRSYAPLPQGGSLSVGSLYGLKLDNQFGNYSSIASESWGIWVGDTDADNWFAKNVIIGGTTEKPVGTESLYVGGEAVSVVAASVPTSVSGSISNQDNRINAVVASGETLSGPGLINVNSLIDRTNASDLGIVQLAVGSLATFSQSTGAKETGAYVGFQTGRHTATDGIVDQMFDFAAFSSTISPGVVTERYGIYIEPDTNAVKKNWIAGFTQMGGPGLDIHATLDVYGTFALEGSTSGTLIQQAAAVTTDYTLTWPDAQGAAFSVLSNDGAGTLSWASPSTFNGHIVSVQTTAPVATVNANAGTGATASISTNATDTAGAVTITVGTIGVSTGSYCDIAFDSAYGSAPIVVLTPASSTLSTSVYVTSSASGFSVNFAVAGGIGSTYVINYYCIETSP